MRRTTLLTMGLAMALVITLGAGTALAGNFGRGHGQGFGHGGHGPGPGHGGHGSKGFGMLRALDLTADQRTQVREIFAGHREAMRDNGDRIMAAKTALIEATHLAPLDEQAVRDAHRELSAAKEDQAVLRARILADIRGILTPEQQARLTQLKDERIERMEERRAWRQARIDDRWCDRTDDADDMDADQ